MIACFQKPYNCTHAYYFIYRFKNPGKVIVTTEYLLQDFISTLGNVGGTLGLFIGFSFSGLISFFLNLLVMISNKMENITNEKSYNQTLEVKENQIDVARIQTMIDELKKEFENRENNLKNEIAYLKNQIRKLSINNF